MTNQESELTFEQAMEQLEELVEKLEAGDVPLEKAIQYYQDGMKLSKLCNEKLGRVEEQMQQVLNEHGEFVPYEVQEDE
ncbi:exodeoxyribonuclease VII small subunit [Halobacillus shinanisalinarum]|uniref:Exodeoxyribonuclease 7 small subunit n=1 Tax=Halobacillus shinanisalinarum TaxID=2932258 RepID=A0ABY4H1A5_9BACI|nr:exodeoxyribonuclease VII small subunit [Halobacillus shinanisalinarum]UOQ93695.1 exodeoxyribonuclease VII small subunit [Halobacillus shinanisalinarum]